MFNLKHCHSQWHEVIEKACNALDPKYVTELQQQTNWLPGCEQLFSAFSLPISEVKYILFGESPYPRSQSANGYAFWDQAVDNLWSSSGLSTQVNRATSLRNLIKMLLVARGDLAAAATSQAHIMQVNKEYLVSTAADFFCGMMNKGILLLNASLVYSPDKVRYHAQQWKPFMRQILANLYLIKPQIQLILLGKIAETILPNSLPVGLMAEHPYNVSFITNQDVLQFFKPLDLLVNDSKSINN